MLYFANPSTPRVVAAMREGRLGCIVTPAQGNVLPEGVAWCADNGCYGAGYPGDERWLSWLERRAEASATCWFAVAPDVVADAGATLSRSLPWLPEIRSLGLPAALVAQDGLQSLEVPWNAFDVLFVGGTTSWKLGPEARSLVARARELGKGVHMGRVNSRRRYAYAEHIGCTSADGTFLAYGPDKNLAELLGWGESLVRA